MKLTKTFMVVLSFVTTSAIAQDVPLADTGVADNAAEIHRDAENIYLRLQEMSPSQAERVKNARSDQCSAIHIADLNANFRELVSVIKESKFPEDVKLHDLDLWQGKVTAQAAIIMMACNQGQIPPRILE